MATFPINTDIHDITGEFDRGIKITFHCALHPEIEYRSKDPFVSQWFPANEITERCEFDASLMAEHCPCTLKNGIWLTSAEYTTTDWK